MRQNHGRLFQFENLKFGEDWKRQCLTFYDSKSLPAIYLF